MQNLQYLIGTLIGFALMWCLIRQYRLKRAHSAAQGLDYLFRDVAKLFDEPSITQGETAGSWKLEGRFKGEVFQIQTVVDTLATRKLPILWVMVTLPKPQDTPIFDVMMRPSGPSTFSNFDFLRHGLKRPDDFPEHAVLRSDELGEPSGPFLNLAREAFQDTTVKEVLFAPKGRRIVFMSAQADRARYGVFREASFGEHVIDAQRIEKLMMVLL
jgi:hypothetical protein